MEMNTALEKTLANLVQKVERRFYGKYRGFVVDNADPERLGRLKVRVPSLLGPNVVTGWAMPCVPYGGDANQGLLFIPEKESGVWIEFEEGDPEFPVWVGTFWSKPGGASEVPKPNTADGAEQDSVQDPPTRKIIKTAGGHTIQFEDADKEVRVIISDGQNENRIIFGSSGLTVVNKGNTITMDDSGIVVNDKNDNTVTQNGNGIRIEDKNGNAITMNATSGGPPPMNAIVVNGSRKICLDGLIGWLMRHTHIGNMGAPCPPNPADLDELTAVMAEPDGSILSKNVTAG